LKDGDVKIETGDIVNFQLDEKYFEIGTKSDVYCDYKNLGKVRAMALCAEAALALEKLP
jgi:hypothetical protein